MRELRKIIIIFRLFEKIRHSNEISTKKYLHTLQESKYLEEENGKMIVLQISPKMESLWIEWIECVDRPQNFKGLYEILQLLQGTHLDNFPLNTLKRDWVSLHSVTFQLKC